MIRNRFSVFQGVGPKTEQVIWNAGILTWDQFLSAGQIKGVSARVRQSLTEKITFWQAALDRKDHRFFAENLAGADHWLLFEEFGDSVCYLDIETTGLSANYGDVTTVVGIYNGQKFEVFIRDDNLAGQTLSKALANCKLLITYNGRTFDVPFLRSEFPKVNWNIPHFDLRFAAAKVGHKGGLKQLEVTLGLARPDEVLNIDGFEAVRLWYAYKRGNSKALELLIEYNRQDTQNMAQIAPIIYKKLATTK